MNDDIDRYLTLARVHDLALDRAQALRHETMVRLWAQVGEALAQSAGGAQRSAQRLWHRMQRHAAGRGGQHPADRPSPPEGIQHAPAAVRRTPLAAHGSHSYSAAIDERHHRDSTMTNQTSPLKSSRLTSLTLALALTAAMLLAIDLLAQAPADASLQMVQQPAASARG